MKRNLVLTDAEEKLSNNDKYEIMNPECVFLYISKYLSGNIDKEDVIKRANALIRLYEDEFKELPKKRDAYITGLRDAFSIFHCGLSRCSFEAEYEELRNICEQIVEKDLLSDELWK